MDKKIKTLKQVVSLVNKLKKEGKKIVTYSGSFDIVHVGHIRVIREAKKQGDILIILLNTDTSIKMYKGSSRPINPENMRSEMLAALVDVDYVVFFNEINPKEILEKIKPNVHCSGFHYGKHSVERNVVEKNGGKIYSLRQQGDFSTSDIITKILKTHALPETKAIFLDRDGTININNPEYIYRIEDFKFIPGVISALKKLSQSDYKIIIVTNQSGIARGYYDIKKMEVLHRWLIVQLGKHGVRIDRIYHCPHGPDDHCECRKPKIGMLMRAVKDFNLNLSKSWVIGDDERDIMMGREANLTTIKIGKKMPASLKLDSHYYAKNLLEAVKFILNP